MKVLFIGNSHTYVNGVPALVAACAQKEGKTCEVAMLAHGGWYLHQHVKEPEVRFNILHGHYDAVVLQEHSHPMAEEEDYAAALEVLTSWIREAGSVPVLYATWAKQAEREKQVAMDACNRRLAQRYGCALAPVGEGWWEHMSENFYGPDGQHVGLAGSSYAASILWKTLSSCISESR